MKWKHLAWALAIAIVACMASTGVVRAEMLDNTNVAYMKTTTSSDTPDVYEPAFYSDWHPVPVDDVFYQGPPGNYCRVRREVNGWIRVNLGSPMNVNWVDLWPNNPAAWYPLLENNQLQGIAANGTDVLYTETIPTGMDNVAMRYKVDVDWQNVQYVRLLDVTDVAGTTDYLVMSDLRVGSNVSTHPGYIGNVAVTSSDVRMYQGATHPWWDPASLTNNMGMTDQGVGVGDPDAQSISTSGNWLSNSVTDADPVLTFDLGGTFEMDMIRIWNFSFAKGASNDNARGTQHCLIEYSDDDGGSWTELANMNGDDPGNYTIAETPGDLATSSYPMYTAQLQVDLGGLSADHFRITCLDNHGATPDLRGLSEVRFYSDDVSPFIPGDADNDGDVDKDDLADMAAHWGAGPGATWSDGDFDGDGYVGPKDAAILASNWGYPGSESTAVPEPSALTLLLGLALMLLPRRRP